AFGFGARFGNDGACLFLRVRLFALILREQRFGFLAKSAGVRQFLGNGGGARVQPFGDQSGHLFPKENGEEDEGADADPGFRLVEEFHAWRSTAWAASAAAMGSPVSRSTMSAAASAAAARTWARADRRVAAMRVSAAVSAVCDCASAACFIASTSAVMRLRF